jgi:hypothetical protein
MNTNLERFRTDLTKLIELGDEMYLDLTFRSLAERKALKKEHEERAKLVKGTFEKSYQRWYSEASSLIKQLMPDRYSEFIHLYHGDNKRKQISSGTYHIQDWLNGIRSGMDYNQEKLYDDFAIIVMRFNTQLEILKAVQSRFESSLFDIAQLVQADLFDSELDAARELANNGFLRGAGAIAGVVLERHLGQVCTNHNVTTRKQHPTISELNDLLKTAAVLDVPTWRQIQRLGDIRNLCDHSKQREPTKDEVLELIDGTAKTCKTLF